MDETDVLPDTTDAMKMGARHTREEFALIQNIHDAAVGLGAACEHPEEEMKTAVSEEPTTTPPQTEPPQTPEPEVKAIAISAIVQAVYARIWRLFDDMFYGSDRYTTPRFNTYPESIFVYDGYAIVCVGLQHFRADYQVVNGRLEMQKPEEWVEVEAEWAEVQRMENTMVADGGEMKALGNGVVGGYLVKFTNADTPDLTGDFFDAKTDFGPHRQSLVYYQHGLDDVLGVKRLGSRYSNGLAELKVDDVGVWIQLQLDMADEYEAALYSKPIKMGKMGWSSGTASHLVRRSPAGKSYHIDSWPLGLDASLTPTPAAGPKMTQVVPLKVYYQEQAKQLPGLKALLQEANTSTADATAVPAPAATPATKKTSMEDLLAMDPEELKKIVGGAVEAAVAPLKAEVTDLKAKLAAEPARNDTGYELPGDNDRPAQKMNDETFKAVYVTRFGDETKAQEAVMTDMFGTSYRQLIWDQNQAFTKYLRKGENRLDNREVKLLQTQIFHYKAILEMLKSHDTRFIKTTMVEAQGSLGGFAIPPNLQANAAQRLPGLTAVRGNGARIINLTTGNGTEVLKYTGGTDRYVGNLRGQWGTETGSLSEQNATLGLDRLDAEIYTYMIKMSRSVVEDAQNLVDLVMDDIVMTGAIDEDEAFLVGDGAGKPVGLLPAGANAHSLTEVNSGGASALTTAGIKALKRGVASQYRGQAIWVGNSDTYSDIEALTVSGTGSDFAFPDLSDNEKLLNRPSRESEAMPDVAANAFPLLFGDMSGYYILDREGMAIERFHDSGTTINQVWFEIRKRLGGRPVQTWKFAVQKVAA